MRNSTMISSALFILAAVGFVTAGAQRSDPKNAVTKPTQDDPARVADQTADEEAIRANVDSFVRAYNARDAKAIAALFLPEAQIIDEDGNTIQGREAIEQVFAEIFEDEPEAKIEIALDSIKLIGTAFAVETGSTTTIAAPGETPEHNRYTVAHVKTRDGRWLMALARDTEGDAPTIEERLQALTWLIGDWIDESPDSLVKTSYQWTDNQHFILGQFTVQISGRPAISGSQRIGWDPLLKQIRSWTFDSEGGFAEGVWCRDGDSWTIKMTGVDSEGRAASATNVLTMLGKDRSSFESHDRILGGEPSEDVGPIQIVRMPPQPSRKTNKQ